MKKLFFLLFIFIVAIITACPSANAPANSNAVSNLNTITNIPPEFSNRPIEPSGNSTPGIPDPRNVNMNAVPKGTTPTPGIPDPKNVNKAVPKGATPTPGIPDPANVKKQMNTRLPANVINQIPKNEKELEKTINDTLKTVRKKP